MAFRGGCVTKPRRSHVWDKDKNGFYIEPLWCSERLFEVEKFSGRIYDPACGTGRIVQAARAAGYDAVGSDLIVRKRGTRKLDFLKSTSSLAKLNVISNPPFDHVREFCEHALELGAVKVAMIMLLRRLNAAHWLRQLPLTTVYLLTPRPSMPPGKVILAGEEPGGGTQDFVWLLINSGYRGQVQMKWMHRDGDKR
jgi:hypothetical protein